MSVFLPLDKYVALHKKKHTALYRCIKDSITSGRLAQGSPLPSTRHLSLSYGLSRGTVNLAYEMLAADGYVQGIQGSGTIVTWKEPARRGRREGAAFRLSKWAARLAIPPANQSPPPHVRHFQPGYIDGTLFPHADWKRCMLRAVREYDPLASAPASGLTDIRAAIAHYLNRRRGLNVSPDQVAVVNGSLQAIAVLCHLLLEHGSNAVMENPGYRGIAQGILLSGARAVYAHVDEHGLKPANWRARAVFVTPARQFPTGVVLSHERRVQLIEWARRENAVIVEDDYDAEFRRGGNPLEPLQMLAAERVVHIGTFSRTLSPFLRIGYAVLPESLIDPFRRAREAFENHTSAWLEQKALAHFIRSGAYERHLRRATRAYTERYETLVDSLGRRMPGMLRLLPSDTGLHVFAYWNGNDSALKSFVNACRAENIMLADAGRFFFENRRPALVFSFAHLQAAQAAALVTEIGRIWKRISAKS